MAVARRIDTSEVPSLLAAGFAHHQAGRLDEAEKIYRRILATQPAHFDGLHLLGVIFQQRGDHVRALRQIDLALAQNPDNVLALNNRGVSLKALGRLDEALAAYNRALAVQPDHADALINHGLALEQLGRFEEALASYERALAARPDHVPALLNRGNVFKALNRFDLALASYDRALAIRPDFADAHCNRANVLHELKRHEEALASCDRAIALRPDFAEAHANRAGILHALKRSEDALAGYDHALALHPDFAEAHFNRANMLHDLQRFGDALASYDRALALRPDYAAAHYNRGNVLYALQRLEDALESYGRALALQPGHAEALTNRGAALQELSRFEEALANYQKALAARPDFADAHYNEAMCRLVTGDYQRGWQKHEWRWDTQLLRHSRRGFAQPLWLGSDEIAGKRILLHAEQGLGDTLQFCRYVPLVAERGARVILEVQKPLRTLMASIPGAIEIVSRGNPLPGFDLHCPLLSLPLAFATRIETIPSGMPYLAADENKVSAWRDRLGKHEKPRIGLVWAGNPRKQLPNANRIDSQRSLRFDQLAPCFQITECEFYSLQKGDDAVRQLRENALCGQVVDSTDELHDFSDTAALVENLDVIISVDTSVAHLAGALGKPFWLLNRYNTCWRWLVDREDSPWYPTARLFRQDASRDWTPVIARVRDALRNYVHEFSG